VSKLSKAKSEPVPNPEPQLTPEFRMKLDRLGYLLDEERRHKPAMAELKALKEESRAFVNASYPADKPQQLSGNVYRVNFGMRENESTVDKPKAFAALKKALGLTKLADALSYTLKLLETHLTDEQRVGLVTKERTGSREIDAVKIAA
jgi:hypothetical protein